jgi:peptidoglycan-associated lipoprotein
VHRTIATLTVAGSALLFAACATTPEDPQTAAEARPSGATTGPQAQPFERQPTAGADLTTGKSIPSQRSIYYDYDKFEIKHDYRGVVEAHAKYLRENPSAKILIQGNADERGSREYNIGLGQRRSDSVKKTLLLLGTKESQIESVSLGEEKPACTDHAENCWWKNRRGDIRYTGEY